MKRIRRAFRHTHTAGKRKHTKPSNQEKAERQQVEQEFDHFFTLSSDIFSIVGFDGYFKRLNPACDRILGFSQTELLATLFLEFVHPDDRAATIAVVQKLITGERVDHFENRYRCQTGSYKWLSWSGIGVPEEELIYWTARDISEQKQAKETLYFREQEFRALVENSPDVILRVDRDCRYLYANPKIEERSGIPAAEYIGKTIAELGFPEDLVALWSGVVQRVIETQQEQWIEFEFDSPTGHIFSHCRLVPEFGDDGLVETVLVVIRDITEYRQVEIALQESEVRFRAFMQHSPIAAWIVDADGRMLQANPNWLQLVQLSSEEVVGKNLFEIFPPDLAQQYLDNNNWVIQSNQVVEVVESAPLPDGTFGDYLVYKFPLGAPNGCSLIGGVAVDITELKRTESALRESEERFRQIAENVHEVFWIADLELSQVIYISPAYEEVWGRSCQSLYEQPRSFVEAIYPEDRNRVIEVLEQKRLSGFSHEYRIVQPDGSIRWIWERAFTVNNPAGDPYRVVGISQDITDRKQAEAALRLADFSFERFALAAVWVGRDARLLRVNQEACRMLGYSREELESMYVYEIDPNFPGEAWAEHWRTLQQQKTLTFTSQLQRKDGSLVPIETTLNYLEFNGKEYNFAFARDISRRLQTEAILRHQQEQEKLVVTIAQHIRQSLDLKEILNRTVTAVRNFLKSDRVLIYQLDATIGGSVIAESVGDGWMATSGTIIKDCYFTEMYAQLYQQGRVHSVDDIYTAGLTDCHVDLLAQFQVRANLAVPIAQEERLWGLLVVQQCDAPRHWQPLETDLLKQLATQVGIAIQQSELYQQAQAEIVQRQRAETALRQRAERERLLASTAQHIRQSLDLNHVLDATVTEVRHLLQADRVLLYWVNPEGLGRVITESVASEYAMILDQPLPPEIFPQNCHQLYQQGRIRKITDIETDEMAPCLAETLRQFGVRSKLVVPILQGDNLWGLLIAHQCSSPRAWQSHEVDFLQQLATQVAIAIQQAELHQQVQQLNANLEIQVQERTLELQQALKFEALLKRITDKVRDSLDETQILQTAVQELVTGLTVQCCDTALYDFEQGQSTVRFEYITSDIKPAVGHTFAFSNLPEVYDCLLQGQHVQFSTVSVPNLWRGEAKPRFTILSCPLMDDQGVLGDLWLFRTCENSFNALEVRLVEQVANQCAIALRQSRLYQAAQTQVHELERLNQLKDDFLNTVSHELRTPMCNIKMAIQMLEVTQPQLYASNSELDRTSLYFNILRNECHREISLINDLLDLTRLDAGTEPLNLTTIDLQAWVPHVLEPFEHRVDSQQQQLHVHIPATLPAITTDLSYLERILTELLNNACKYTPAEGEICVSVEAISGEGKEPETTAAAFILKVCNSGVEIPDNELERIFDRFYRVPNNDPWKHGGTGLGLALVKRLVERMNGKIEVSSHNKQTMFTIQLPLVMQTVVPEM